MAQKFLRLSDVLTRYGLGKSTIYDLISKEKFPAPVHIGRSARWSIEQLERYDVSLSAHETVGV
tara:strand:- start:5629 stop:5820 length:192 start_codon:yes stop_codon:yes gene_type:complete